MKLQLFQTLSFLNKTILPKMYKTADLANLSLKEKLVFGWKRWVTLKYFEEKNKDLESNSRAYVQRGDAK